ncbi:mortality factor 4-like protein 2 [Arvicola amphibius]|uniref:mortality factor 4-like protein 2 n=1 Tax=Arvicola amphibius TaxID=1047088 RepID=UPI0018E3694D|nr:mortality factor 4-like protein 2 [Arvicola amphibius]
MGVELMLPDELKSCLVEDWELINKHKQLFQLPAEKNIDTILAEYVTFVKSQGKADSREYSVDELVYGIREYFNRMLGTQLLCQFEKLQFAEVHLAYPHIPISQLYGAPHFLRLFTQIGTILTHSLLSRHSLMRVSIYLHDFLKYLAENSTSLFIASNYNVASAEYCCQAL